MKRSQINYWKEVFLHPWNLTFLISVMAAVLGVELLAGNSPDYLVNTILVFSAALELLVLGYVPHHKRFRRLVDSQHAAEQSRPLTQRELYSTLSRPNQRRFARLSDLRKKIEANYGKLSFSSQGLVESHIRKLDGLLTSCLNLLAQKERDSQFGSRADKEEVAESILELQREMQNDHKRIRAIKQRRLKVLEQRLYRFKRSSENLEIIEAQVETIEDVVKYIHEQSLSFRNPEEISYQLDVLLTEVEETETTIGETEAAFSDAVDAITGLDLPEPEFEPDAQRGRLRV